MQRRCLHIYFLLFSLVRAYVLNSNKQKLLKLEKRHRKGVTDAAAVERNDNFISLREDAEFKRIVSELIMRVESPTS
jgi:hypothetical protein